MSYVEEPRMMKNWAICQHEGEGKLRYLGVVSATGQEEAVSKAIKLLLEEDPRALCATLWEGERA
jgi:hypothetical protein